MSKYIGPKYIESFNYRSVIKFRHYNQMKQIQIIHLYFHIWNILYKDLDAVYFPFFTQGIEHKLINQDYLL